MPENTDGYFKTGFTIGYKGIKPDLKTNFTAFMECLQEAGSRHTESTPNPMKWYMDNACGFLITNMHVKIHKYPSINDEIEIMTAPLMFKGVFAERIYRVTSQSGEELAVAFSSWIFVDLEKRRPVRIPDFIAAEYGKFAECPPEKDFTVPDTAAMEKINEDRFRVSRRDTDSYGHVNNIVYLEWAQNYIPDDIYRRASVAKMKAHYKKECMEGDEILAETFAAAGDGSRFVTVFSGAEEKNVLASVLTIWTEN